MAGLELGCGPGQAGAELRRRVDHLTGVDLSPAMIEQAGRRGDYTRLVTADLMRFLGDPAEEESFDLIFASDVLPHIFDKFVKGQAPPSAGADGGPHNSVGVGLGLAIAKGIMGAHAGSIAAESPISSGRGTRMTMTFSRGASA